MSICISEVVPAEDYFSPRRYVVVVFLFRKKGYIGR